MLEYGRHLEGGEHCVYTRNVETRNKGLRTITNLLGKVVKKDLVQESEFSRIEQAGWIESENHRTVLVGFSSGGNQVVALVKKLRVTLT